MVIYVRKPVAWTNPKNISVTTTQSSCRICIAFHVYEPFCPQKRLKDFGKPLNNTLGTVSVWNEILYFEVIIPLGIKHWKVDVLCGRHLRLVKHGEYLCQHMSSALADKHIKVDR